MLAIGVTALFVSAGVFSGLSEHENVWAQGARGSVPITKEMEGST